MALDTKKQCTQESLLGVLEVNEVVEFSLHTKSNCT